MKTLALLLVAVVAAQCTPDIKPTPEPEPVPTPWPVPEPDDASACADACRRLRALGCEAAKPTTAGGTCEDVCENAARSAAPLPTRCIASARSCAAADACQDP